MNAAVFMALLSAVCWVESNHRPHVVNVEDGGSASIGDCQIKHSTATQMGFRGHAKELLDRSVNRRWAAAYLAHQLRRYRGDVPRALSAYNAGTATTKNGEYVNKVLRALGEGR